MAFSHVQGTTGGHGGTGSTITLTFGGAIGSGNTVCGGGQFSTTAGPIVSVQDDKGNSYNLETVIANSDGQSGFAFSLGNITNGPTTITVTLTTSSGYNSAVADEYSGAATLADPRDVHGGQSQNLSGAETTDQITSGSFTTAANGVLIYGLGVCTNSATAIVNWVAGTGFAARSRDASGAGSALSEDLVQSSAGSIAATFTDSVDTGAVHTVVYLIAIKAPAASSFITIGIGGSEW